MVQGRGAPEAAPFRLDQDGRNFRRTRYRGVERTSFAAYLVGAAYNLLRIAKLCPSG